MCFVQENIFLQKEFYYYIERTSCFSKRSCVTALKNPGKELLTEM